MTVEEQAYDEVEDAVAKLLAALGVQPDEHLAETPRRVAQAWRDQLWGTKEDPRQHLKTTFPGPPASGVIIQAGIDVQSICAHHLLPFGGRATVAYRPYPGQRVVGLSKLARVVYGYSARLQYQERIGYQVVDAIMHVLAPEWAACLLTCTHDCIRLRGVRSPDTETTTECKLGRMSDSDISLVHGMHARGSTL